MKKVIRFPIQLINKFPLATFILSIIILIALIAIGQLIKPKSTEIKALQQPRLVKIYDATQTQFYQTTGSSNITSLTTITASTTGIITKLNTQEGTFIKKGNQIATISTDIWGNNPATLQSQISELNLNFLNNSSTLSSEINKLQKDLAELGDTVNDKSNQINKETSERLKNLSNQTTNLISQTQSQLDQALTDPNLTSQIPTLEQTKLTLESSLNQLKSALSIAELQSPDNTPAQISDRSRDLSNKQLELKQQSEDLSKNLASINLKLTQLNESLYKPSSPISGVVQQIYVKTGQQVNPGTPIAQIASDKSEMKITTLVPANFIKFIDTNQLAQIIINNQTYSAPILYISQVPTLNQLHLVTLFLNQASINPSITGTPEIRFPLNKSNIFIPIDSIYQTANTTYIYKVNNSDSGTYASKQTIQTGEILGSLIQVINGIDSSDQIIISRYVTPDQPITTN